MSLSCCKTRCLSILISYSVTFLYVLFILNDTSVTTGHLQRQRKQLKYNSVWSDERYILCSDKNKEMSIYASGLINMKCIFEHYNLLRYVHLVMLSHNLKYLSGFLVPPGCRGRFRLCLSDPSLYVQRELMYCHCNCIQMGEKLNSCKAMSKQWQY